MRHPVPAEMHNRAVDQVQRKHHFAQILQGPGIQDTVLDGEFRRIEISRGGGRAREGEAEDEQGRAEGGDEGFPVGIGVGVWEEAVEGDVARGLCGGAGRGGEEEEREEEGGGSRGRRSGCW